MRTAAAFDTTVFTSGSGEGGYAFFRIPSLLSLPSSTLLAFAEGRAQKTDHGKVDIVLKRSNDDGRSWSPLTVVHAAESGASKRTAMIVAARAAPSRCSPRRRRAARRGARQ